VNHGRVLWGGAWRFTCFDTAAWDLARVFEGGIWVLLLFSGASTPFFYVGGLLEDLWDGCCVLLRVSIVISADYLFKRLPYLTCNFHLYEVIWL